MTISPTLGLTRTDRIVLRILQIGGWAGAALTAIGGLFTTVMHAMGGGAARLTTQATVPPSGGSVDVLSMQTVESVLRVEGQPAHLTAAMVAALGVRAAGLALVLIGIALLAGRLLRGRALLQAAQVPLGLVLVGVAGAPVVADALEGWVSMATWDAMGNASGFGAVAAFSPMAIFLGLAVGALMIVFRIAGRLEQDAQGLV
ncbi:hypothetical protein [Agrococcus beijingensis]|uniref:hypothetical protein n=1 Tax=Agrococcus beijingensis TaxID=3068634 RepID=UPI0027406A49|nr:hypothetical protein [Agrococcus sp. REN33]